MTDQELSFDISKKRIVEAIETGVDMTILALLISIVISWRGFVLSCSRRTIMTSYWGRPRDWRRATGWRWR